MEKHIINWNDGEAQWAMVIESGKVEIRTADATKADAAAALSAEWSRLMGFATGTDQPTNRLPDAK
jgi:hypothetical protein